MIKACQDEDAYKVLLGRMRVNIKHGAFTIGECKHDPPCTPPSPEDRQKLENRLAEDLAKPQST